MHGERPPKPEKPKRIPRGTQKMKKIQPEHTHDNGQFCELCATHGDVMDSGLTGEEYIGSVTTSEYKQSSELVFKCEKTFFTPWEKSFSRVGK